MPFLPGLLEDVSPLVPRQPFEAATRAVSGALDEVVSHVVDAPSKVLKRSSTTSSSTSTCTASGSSSCSDSSGSGSSLTMPIVLATVIPVCIALVIFVFLHRRHLKRLRQEDENDKHKSLDFGMDEVARKGGAKGNKKGRTEKMPEMSVQDARNEVRKGRGLSMDLATSNPYLLPPGLQNSRESIHSLTRSMNGSYDPYRPATMVFNHGDGPGSNYSPSLGRDDSSSYSASTRRGYPVNESSQNLIRGASPMSRSIPGTQRSSMDSSNAPFPQQGGYPRRPVPQGERLSPIEQNGPTFVPTLPDPIASPAQPPQRKSPPPAAQGITSSRMSPPQAYAGLPNNPKPIREDPPAVSPFLSQEEQYLEQYSAAPRLHIDTEPQDFDNNFRIDPPSPDRSHGYDDQDTSHAQQYEADLGYDIRRLTMGIRPLPPDDPSENPEQRANRIRSFYKEYFDETTPQPRYHEEEYYEDYPPEFASYDAPIYDPDSGQFITWSSPYAEPITRRAMTPPPQGPPRFRGANSRIPSSGSDGTFGRGRAMSTTSGKMTARQQASKKRGPPPKPLAILPTPHMLKDDTIIPIDFAPPQSFNDRIRGTPPDSPTGGFKPYSPGLKPGKMLVSSFDDLAIMPSPHALRKSGTFTSLDFALPPRFKNSDTGSDAGSIRSNRSGVSAIHAHNIRSGAYRISRIPKDQVGTTDDFKVALKPSWDMRK